MRRLARTSVRGPTWGLDAALLAALTLAATSGAVVFWFHIVFVVLTVSAMFLGLWAFAVRVLVWVPLATMVVAEAVREGTTQTEELIEIPLLSSILVVVFVVSLWRARTLAALERAQTLLVERHRSELSKLERELETSRKMDALGRLAGGIAHDFNNVLTAIVGHCEDIIDRVDGHAAMRPAREIESAVHRATSLVDDLMSFSRAHVLQPTIVDLDEVVSSMAAMLEPLIGEDVRQHLRPRSEPCRVHLVRSRLEQVVVNLVVNAREAMPHGGHIELATAIVELDESHTVAGEVPAGSYATLTVSDDGIGIEPGDLERIFEPFFTTKDTGHGAGLGLSTVRDIVAESGGAVTVDSALGRGSRFTVYLPLPTSVPALETPAQPPRITRGGTETVLLIEDDAAVRTRARKLLEGSGYTVLDAPDGERGLELAARRCEPIDLLVTDVVMPGIDGLSVARQLTTTRPDTRVLFVSGYTKERVRLSAALGDRAEVLAKPFTRDELLSHARAALDAG